MAEIVGYGASADAFRITDQDPAGEGGASAMRNALADADDAAQAVEAPVRPSKAI